MTSRSSLLAKLIRIGAALLCAVALSACAEWFTYRQSFEVTVDLTAEGERMQIVRQIVCIGEVGRNLSLRSYVVYRPSTSGFGARLVSGAAVMVVTPAFCERAHDWEEAKNQNLPVPKGHIPLIGWANDADRPTVIEAYVSKDYFTRQNARIRYHGMSARSIDPISVKPGPVDEFPWFGSAWHLHWGYYVNVIPKDAWNEIELVAAHVSNAKAPVVLPQELSFLIGSKHHILDDPAGLYSGIGIFGTPALNSGIRGAKPESIQILANIQPLFRTPEGYSIRASERGYFVFYRSDGMMPNDLSDQQITINLDGTTIPLSTKRSGPYAIYDPKSEAIFVIDRSVIDFPPRVN